MEKEKILIDVDDVICEGYFIPLVNEFLGTSYVSSDFDEYYIDDLVFDNEEEKQKFYNFYLTKNGYEYAILKPQAYEVIEELNKKYDVYIFSACVDYALPRKSGIFFKNKFNYLIETLPFIDPNKIILTNSKNLITADYQIDDKITNLEGNIKNKYLFTAKHNEKISDEELIAKHITRVNDWDELKSILLI
ncbi:MAG: hypothetical protein RSE48_04955 [Bacilli bacterium]